MKAGMFVIFILGFASFNRSNGEDADGTGRKDDAVEHSLKSMIMKRTKSSINDVNNVITHTFKPEIQNDDDDNYSGNRTEEPIITRSRESLTLKTINSSNPNTLSPQAAKQDPEAFGNWVTETTGNARRDQQKTRIGSLRLMEIALRHINTQSIIMMAKHFDDAVVSKVQKVKKRSFDMLASGLIGKRFNL